MWSSTSVAETSQRLRRLPFCRAIACSIKTACDDYRGKPAFASRQSNASVCVSRGGGMGWRLWTTTLLSQTRGTRETTSRSAYRPFRKSGRPEGRGFVRRIFIATAVAWLRALPAPVNVGGRIDVLFAALVTNALFSRL